MSPLVINLQLTTQQVELILLGLNTLPRMQSDELYRAIESMAVQQLQEWREAAAAPAASAAPAATE